jgi:hypothetical protein
MLPYRYRLNPNPDLRGGDTRFMTLGFLIKLSRPLIHGLSPLRIIRDMLFKALKKVSAVSFEKFSPNILVKSMPYVKRFYIVN